MHHPIRIPPLWCPLDLRVKDAVEATDARTLAWLEHHGVDERSLRRAPHTNTGFLACSWAPSGTEEGVQLLSDWLMWALLYDDHYCDSGPHASRPDTFNTIAARMMVRAEYPATPPTGDPAFDAFASALADLVRRIHALAPPALAHLCGLAHYQWALGTVCGVSDRSAEAVRSMEDHLLIRPADGASVLAGHLIEVADGTLLPAHERVRPAVQALTQAAGILLTVPTDLTSYGRERQQQSLESNIVHVLARRQAIPVQEATHEACALLETVMEFFVTMRRRLRKDAGPELLRYTDQLANMVRGTYEWQRSLPRYTAVFDDDGGADDDGEAGPTSRRSGTVLHEITSTRTRWLLETPAPLAWWWDLLDE
ncbi:terpene synthase family protein [Streptomyces sp. bgisy022]|uniref:terpene synthase family protein n=1 Tax=Streptomyces sp. bgisy022 TaxID=3413769 RepID=UPI003D765BAB